MSVLSGYFTDHALGQPVYRCLFCPWDTFEEKKAVEHARNHGEIRLPQTDEHLKAWIQEQKEKKWAEGKRLTIGFLTWNTAQASYLGAKTIAEEIVRLQELGVQASYFWVDNGSTDETIALVSSALDGLPGEASLLSENKGQCTGRNEFVRGAMANGSQFLLMVDGDIEIIPYSAYAMMLYLLSQPDKIGCIGMLSANCTHVYDPTVSQYCTKIEPQWVRQEPRIAWTNYGLFRVQMFREGILFDDSGPFAGPGWGMEDDDLYLQMYEKGYDCRVTPVFRHYHRKRNSSLDLIGRYKAKLIVEERKKYMVEKWKDIPSAAWRVRQISAMHVPHIPLEVPKQREHFRATV